MAEENSDSLKILRGLSDNMDTAISNSHAMLAVANSAQLNNEQLRLIKRSRELADQYIKTCNPDIELPNYEEDMGDVNIISGNVVADENALSSLVSQTYKKNGETEKKPKPAPDQPTPQPSPQPPPAQPSLRIPGWMKAGVAAAGIAGTAAAGVGIYNAMRPPPSYRGRLVVKDDYRVRVAVPQTPETGIDGQGSD